MAIIRKTELTIHIDKLDQNYKELREAIEGSEPNINLFNLYSLNAEDYKRDFTEVDITRLEYAIDGYKSSLVQIGKIQKKQAPRRASNK